MLTTLRARLAVALAVALVVLALAAVVLGVLALRLSDERATGRTWSDASRRVLDLGAAWEAQQAAVRGLELTGDDVFEDEYRGADGRAAAQEQALRVLAASDGDLSRGLGSLVDETATARRRWMADVVDVRLDQLDRGQSPPAGTVVDAQEAFAAAKAPLEALRAATTDGVADSRDDIRTAMARMVAGAAALVVLAASGFALVILLVRRWVSRPVAAVHRSLDRLASGDLQHEAASLGPAELAGLAEGLERVRQRLRDEAHRVVEASYVAAADDERARLAADVHDDTLQTLAAVSIRLELAARHAETDSDLREQLDVCRAGIADASKRLRTLLFELNPPSLATAGLAAALEDYAEFVLGGSDTEVEVQGTLAEEPPRAMQALAYRIGRELILDVARHAEAATVSVSVASRPGQFGMVVEDDGRSLLDDEAPTAPAGGGRPPGPVQALGALVAGAGGAASILDRPGGGTRVEIWLPA